MRSSVKHHGAFRLYAELRTQSQLDHRHCTDDRLPDQRDQYYRHIKCYPGKSRKDI